MRVYHFINTQYGLQVLLERRLKISRVYELNDPFEFIAMDLSEDTLREATDRIWGQVAQCTPEWTAGRGMRQIPNVHCAT